MAQWIDLVGCPIWWRNKSKMADGRHLGFRFWAIVLASINILRQIWYSDGKLAAQRVPLLRNQIFLNCAEARDFMFSLLDPLLEVVYSGWWMTPKVGVAKVTWPTFEAMGQIPAFHRTYFLLLLIIILLLIIRTSLYRRMLYVCTAYASCIAGSDPERARCMGVTSCTMSAIGIFVSVVVVIVVVALVIKPWDNVEDLNSLTNSLNEANSDSYSAKEGSSGDSSGSSGDSASYDYISPALPVSPPSSTLPSTIPP